MKFEKLIFDLDGTISDPSQGILRSVNFALQALGYGAVDGHVVRPLIGPPLQQLLGELVGQVSNETMSELIAKYRERYAIVGYSENRLYDGMSHVIAKLSTSGTELGICTSKRVDFAKKIVNMFGLTECFQFVDGGDIGVSKSDQLARLVESGVSAATAVMIGDRAVDILAARANGIASIGVLWGFGEPDELHDARPDYIVKSPDELVGLNV